MVIPSGLLEKSSVRGTKFLLVKRETPGENTRKAGRTIIELCMCIQLYTDLHGESAISGYAYMGLVFKAIESGLRRRRALWAIQKRDACHRSSVCSRQGKSVVCSYFVLSKRGPLKWIPSGDMIRESRNVSVSIDRFDFHVIDGDDTVVKLPMWKLEM